MTAVDRGFSVRPLEAGPDAVAFGGEIWEQTCGGFEGALDLLRRSDVEAPAVELSGVSCISSRAIGLLVMLWIDMLDQGRWFDLQASDRVWKVLGKTGAAGVFFKRPDARLPAGREGHP